MAILRRGVGAKQWRNALPGRSGVAILLAAERQVREPGLLSLPGPCLAQLRGRELRLGHLVLARAWTGWRHSAASDKAASASTAPATCSRSAAVGSSP